MKRLFIHGLGAVSAAGWGVPAVREAIAKGASLPVKPLARPGWKVPLLVRQSPPPATGQMFLAHPRLRRASPIAQHTVAAALEALGNDAARVKAGDLRLGIIVCLMTGCVNYSRRFCEETFKDPATASPLLFPETVFNSSASHLAAYLESTVVSYTLVGDEACLLQGLAIAAQWLATGRTDACVVIGAEEMDWIVADALNIFQPGVAHADGAGALYLRADPPPAAAVELVGITDALAFTRNQNRLAAARAMRAQLSAIGPTRALCLGTRGWPRLDGAEDTAWEDWTGFRVAPKMVLGEAFTASAAWQCVWACEAAGRGEFSAVDVSVVGTNQAAIGARFERVEFPHCT